MCDYTNEHTRHPLELEVRKWSNIAYDLASALIECDLDGTDGPPSRPRHCMPPCDCLMHRALQAWGDAQMEYLDRVNPDWREETYGESLQETEGSEFD